MIQQILNIANIVLSCYHKADKAPMFTPEPDTTFDTSRLYTDYQITDKYHKGWKRNLDSITEICIHHTDGGRASGLMRWMLNDGRPGYKRGIGLFPLIVDTNGDTYKIGALSRWWYASGSGKHDSKVINIELCHKSGDFTEEQYESLSWICFDYIPHHCKNIKTIVGHDRNRMKYSHLTGKGCPSDWFNWNRVLTDGKAKGLNLIKTGFQEITKCKEAIS